MSHPSLESSEWPFESSFQGSQNPSNSSKVGKIQSSLAF